MKAKDKHTVHIGSKIPISRSENVNSIINKIHEELKFINAVEIVDRPESFTLSSISITKDDSRLLMNTIFEVEE